MYNEFQKESKLEDSLALYMPPGFKDTQTDDERIKLTESWIKDVIRPTVDYFFSKQSW
jgi:hypothetical protein